MLRIYNAVKLALKRKKVCFLGKHNPFALKCSNEAQIARSDTPFENSVHCATPMKVLLS